MNGSVNFLDESDTLFIHVQAMLKMETEKQLGNYIQLQHSEVI